MCARSVTENFNCEEYEPGGLLGQYDYVKCVKMSLEREAIVSVLVTDNPDRGMIPPYPKIIIGLARQGPLVPIPGFEPGNRKCEDNGIPKHFCTFFELF